MLLSYERYARWLKWMTLGLLAYVLELGFVHIEWRNLLHALVLPHVAFTHEYATTAVAVLGTTLSPYLFVWQAALEVEETQPSAATATPRARPARAAKPNGASRSIPGPG